VRQVAARPRGGVDAHILDMADPDGIIETMATPRPTIASVVG